MPAYGGAAGGPGDYTAGPAWVAAPAAASQFYAPPTVLPVGTYILESFTGGDGSTPGSLTFGGDPTIAGGVSLLTGRARFATGVTGGYSSNDKVTRRFTSADGVALSVADIDITLTYSGDGTESYPSIYARAVQDGHYDGQTGYELAFKGAGVLELGSSLNYVGTTLGRFTYSDSPGVLYKVRFRVVGSRLQVWQTTAGAQFSVAPQIDATDTTLTAAGSTGITVNGGNAATQAYWFVDDLTVTDGATVTAFTGDAAFTGSGQLAAAGGIPAASFVERFDSGVQDAARWDWYGAAGDVSIVGGALQAKALPAYPAAQTTGVYNLVGSSATVQVVGVPNLVANGSTEAMLRLSLDSANEIAVVWANGQLYFRTRVNYAYSDVGAVPFDQAAMAWWRIREQGGTLYWDTSPDSVAWTVRRTLAGAPFPLNALKIGLLAGNYNNADPATVGVATFDNLNAPPAPAYTGAAAFGGSGSLAATGTATLPGPASFTGSGQATVTGSAAPAATAGFTGSGALAAAGSASTTAAASFAGSGQLSATGTAATRSPATFTGTGTLTATGTPTVASAATFTGAGSLTVTATTATAGAAGFTGSGQTSAGGVPAPTGTAAFTGSGQLAAAGQPGMSGAAAFTGAGQLAAASTATTSAGAAFAGAGQLAAASTPATSTAAGFSGAGQASAAGTPSTGTPAALSGSGTLTATTAASASAAVGFTGSGQVAATTAPTIGVVPAFTGSGALTASGTTASSSPTSFAGSGALTAVTSGVSVQAAAFTGAGSLAAAVKPGTGGTAYLSGDGTLTTVTLTTTTAAGAFTGAGDLTTAGRAGVRGAPGFTGDGALTVIGAGGPTRPGRDITVTGTLPSRTKTGTLPGRAATATLTRRRWDGTL